MSTPSATFSESWYRVAGQRLALRPSVQVHRQEFRGERWIVLQNPLSNQFFRLRPAAYEFVARLRPEKTVEEVWKECLDRFPDEAPGQEAVIQLLAQLYQASLLQYTIAADAEELFKRYERTQQREMRARLLNIMFMRFRLLDPDRFLVRTLPVLGKLVGFAGLILWVVVVGWALKVVADNFTQVRNQAQGVLDPSNLLPLYFGLVVIKTLHEFGHALFCRKFGGEVHTLGLMLVIFTPMPYMDATSAWGFRERWKRVLVGAAGMIVELFVAAIATFVWANTGTGWVHGVAYNMMFVASVSTLIFNLNPLLRFDGYYILSDLVGIPNLNQRATRQLRFLCERHLFGLRRVESPAATKKEAGWLTVFGITSGIYRVFVFGGILLTVADRFLLIGLVMAAVCAVAWVAVPVIGLVKYLATSPALDRQRSRAVAVSCAIAAALLVLLEFVPFPSHFRAPGILRSREWTEVHNLTSGSVRALLVQPGSTVTNGQPLIELTSPDLEFEMQGAAAQYEEIQARLRQAMQDAVPNLKPLTSYAESVEKRLERLRNDARNLTVRATQGGIWVAPGVENFPGRWLGRGTALGTIIDPSGFQFQAVVRQEDGDRLFTRAYKTGEVRVYGQASSVIRVANIRVIPGEKRQLPSAALGWGGGGPVEITSDDPEGRKTKEPFFEVRADVLPGAVAAQLHGRSGKVRFDLEPEPVLPRLVRSLRQLLQTRYKI